MREISVWLGPFVRDHDAYVRQSGRDTGEVELADDLGDILELFGERLVLTVPRSHSPTRLLGSTKIRRFVKLFGRSIGVAPEIDADAACAKTRIDLRAIVGGNSLGGELRSGSAHLMDHDGMPCALGKSEFKGCAIGSASREQSVREQVRSVEGEGMDAEEVYELCNIVGPKGTVAGFLATGSDDDGMQLVELTNAINDQPSPVDGHRVGCLPAHDPERRLIGQVPGDNRALVRVMAAEFGSEIGFEAQHFRIGMGMAAMAPGHIPVGL